jgi:hypothetical protein
MAANNMEIPPLVIDLAKLTPSPRAKILATNLEKAQAQDKFEGGIYFRFIEAFNHLKTLSAEPPPEKKPDLTASQDIPFDPVRQPRAYLERMLRDAMRSTDPLDVLSRLSQTTDKATKLLRPQERYAFLGQLRSQAGILASQFLPGLLENVQEAASKNDKKQVKKWVDTALEFCEYAPRLKPLVAKAHEKANTTLSLFSLFGQVDEKTGQPLPPPEPEEP